MWVHAVGSVPGWPRAGSSSDGFVVAEAFGRGGGVGEVPAETEGEIVTVTLRGGACVEAAEDDVGYSLRLGEDF